MKLPIRFSALFFIGLFAAGSTVLGYYYYFVYSPPLIAAERFMQAMENRDPKGLAAVVTICEGAYETRLRSPEELESREGSNEIRLRDPEDTDIRSLLADGFERGRMVDQKKRIGQSRTFHYLVYRQPNARVYALIVAEEQGRFRVVLPDRKAGDHPQYLWDYDWRN